ncbi:MAG: DUF2177 family protein [Bacteroidales bacterium]|nr:DUF2177 family protein [Bacteroidales bacterium]MCF8391239.1 DUF2177 family protein [Bacteroidales bacterium]
MNILNIIISYFFTFLVFLAVDMLWLGVIAKNLYRKYLGTFLSDQINWTAAFIFYLIFVIGISIFSIYPAVQRESASHAVLMGVLFGFFTYATYDLTNLSTLKGWPVTIVIIDIIWGSVLSAMVSFAGFHIVKWIN